MITTVFSSAGRSTSRVLSTAIFAALIACFAAPLTAWGVSSEPEVSDTGLPVAAQTEPADSASSNEKLAAPAQETEENTQNENATPAPETPQQDPAASESDTPQSNVDATEPRTEDETKLPSAGEPGTSSDTDEDTNGGTEDASGGADNNDEVTKSTPAQSSTSAKTSSSQTTQKAATSTALASAQNSAVVMQDTGQVMHRMYNPNSGEHFYTADTTERDVLTVVGWIYEGIGWIAPLYGDEVYRLYNPNAGDHHYTLSKSERDHLVTVGWLYEGVCWHSGGSYRILRQYNPNAVAGAHNFTPSQSENDYLARVGWHAEGIGWYALADTQAALDAYLAANFAITRAHVESEGTTVVVDASLIGDTYYLFLPSYADLSSLKVVGVFKGAETATLLLANSGSTAFSTIAKGASANITSISHTTAKNGAKLLWFRTSATSSVQRLAIMKSSSVSTVNVTSVNSSYGRAYVEASPNHSAKADVLVTVIDANGTVAYNGDDASNPSTIKGRGNSTWGNGVKKPYQIKLNTKADLLQTGESINKAKKWILLANSADPALVRNLFAYNLGIELGMTGTECALVDLYYDGDYRGSYLLCEKIEVGEGRVNIADLEKALEKANKGTDLATLPRAQAKNKYGKTFQYVQNVADPEDITGGYILELDVGYYAAEACWFEASHNFEHVVVKSPEYCSYNAMKYISEYFEAAVQRLANNVTTAEDNALFDIDSLAKTYIVSEVTKEIDTFYSSTYFYKDSDSCGDGRIYAAPLWDFDTIGIRSESETFYYYHEWLRPDTNIEAASNALIQEAAKRIWAEELYPLLTNVCFGNAAAVGPAGHLRSFAFYRTLIDASQRMNELKFGITSFDFQLPPFNTYDRNFNYLKDWLSWRTAWVNDNISKLTGVVRNSSTAYNGVDYALVFDASYYKQQVGKPTLTDEQALADFVQNGMRNGVVASRNFNVTVYRNKYADLRKAFGSDLSLYYKHYIEFGFAEQRECL